MRSLGLAGLNPEGITAKSLAPSPRLLQAALSGLMAAGALGCSDSDDSAKKTEGASQELTDEELKSACAGMVAEAKKTAAAENEDKAPSASSQTEDLDTLCADRVKDAQNACTKPESNDSCKDAVTTAVGKAEKPEVTTYCADTVKQAVTKATTPKTPEEKTTSAEQKEYTFAELNKMCDARGGYVEVHAACGGHNSCTGFSYGDWGPGAATLTEHTCTGVNGCAGLSCVVLPEEKNKDKSGAEMYDLMYGDTEPSACTNCHADSSDADNPDKSKFLVYVLEGSTRTEANWLDRSAAEQERIVAFGAHSTLADGTALNDMAAYNKVLSRKEVEKVVAYLRTLKPVIKTIKTKDPAATPTAM